jgi:hypothetical protein
MPTYLLDIVVEEAQLYQSMSFVRSPIWVRVCPDGVEQYFETPPVAPGPSVVWHTPVRFVLNLPTLNAAHLRASIRTHGGGAASAALACSQIQLGQITLGRPSHFAFPLLLAPSFIEPAANLTVTMSFSQFNKVPVVQIQPVVPRPQIRRM